ncbi:fumarylacetoacetate hydrolase [Marssonina coronariae]|uniref:Fumarylacetoacetate hydrolase n=1 Tax=Diplocarpon coronariae TaxID=2795749 RepID=A0A218Z765_9HELO|nr:fumarylacetoacetate hydrolase [Marssonina coronariae]
MRTEKTPASHPSGHPRSRQNPLQIFLKPDICVHSPILPLTLRKITSWECDAEVELAVVISKMCRDVTPARATEFVLGYMTANDMTARKIQGRGSQWGYSKGFDGFCPMRPCLVARKAIPDPSLLLLKTTLDGWLAQNGTAKNLVFSVAECISHISQGTTLTVVFTGTPAGIGHSYSPPLYLKKGSDLKMWISHSLGTLVNEVEQGK